MPDLSELEKMEKLLFEALEVTRRRFEISGRHRSEYEEALQRFNQFVIDRKVPDDWAT